MSTEPDRPGPAWRTWAPDAALAVAVLALGLTEVSALVDTGSTLALVLVCLGIATAVGLSRAAPGVGLVLVWVTGGILLVYDLPLLYAELSVAVVAFGTARWGSTVTVVASGLSIPVSAVVGVLGVLNGSVYGGLAPMGGLVELVRAAHGVSDSWPVGAVVIGMALLGAPWLAGLTLRFVARARRSEVQQASAEQDALRAQRDTEQAVEIARLRDEQARMARDVHDVVGHSLAVILAQAESAQYLPDDDPGTLKETMATIATSARASLQDVRQVLSGPQHVAPSHPGGLESLIEGVRAGGHEVLATEIGTPQPLPPDLELVAFRVMQEMLTNAIKHGRRDHPVLVERHWPEGRWDHDLRIEVRNVEDRPPEQTQPLRSPGSGAGEAGRPGRTDDGQGLDGMRRRLDSVGGRIDVRRRDEPDGPTFTVTAWVPVRVVQR
jgi:signal transduction histidine kinase